MRPWSEYPTNSVIALKVNGNQQVKGQSNQTGKEKNVTKNFKHHVDRRYRGNFVLMPHNTHVATGINYL